MEKSFGVVIRTVWQTIQNGFIQLIEPLTSFLIRMEINPNALTTMGFGVSLFAGYFFGVGALRIGGAVVLLSGLFDIMDGKIARGTNQVTRFGALYDSTLDRYAEIFVFMGLGYYFIAKGSIAVAMLVFLVLGGSLMVSYVRARAEGLGFSCKVGMMQRPERIVTLGISSLVHESVLVVALIFLAITANYTAIQRIRHIWLQENGKKHEPVTDYDKRG